MRVRASIGNLSKVTYDGTATSFQTGDQLALWAWTGESDVLPKDYAVNGQVNTLTESGDWVPAAQMLWKNTNDDHYFIAVHPAPASTVKDLAEVPYKIIPEDYEASDLLLATELSGLKASSGAVDLVFSHAMAKLNVNLRFRNQFGAEGPNPQTVSAALEGKSAAMVNYLTKAVTPSGDDTSVALASAPAASGYAMSFSGIQIPQEATKIVVTAGGSTFTYTHPEALPLYPGKVTTLNFIVGQDVIVLESVSVNAWVFDTALTGGEAELYNVVELSELTGDYEALNGDILTGTLAGNYKISIADGATVTLDGMAINGVNDENYKWAGITCVGDATIILKEGSVNSVMGFYETAPGIFIPEGKTLVIKGEGSLTASTYIKDPSDIYSYGFGAGIGGGRDVSCGNIEIQGGIITAIGGMYAAGIGTGGIENENSTNCGTITISGGSVVATSKYYGAGIGCGYSGICDIITISGGTVEATGGYAGPGIGSTVGYSECGDITISGGTVTATTSNSAPGIGCANEPSVCGNITISGGTVTAIGKQYSPGIGAGGSWFNGGSCGNITITSGVTKVTAIKGVSDNPSDPTTPNSIGSGLNVTSCGTVTIGGVEYPDGVAESPFIYPVPFADVTSADMGKVIGANGVIYDSASDAITAGTTAVAIVAYVGAAGSVDSANTSYKGLAIAMSDASSVECQWYVEKAYLNCVSISSSIGSAIGFKNGIECTNTLVNSNGTGVTSNCSGHTHAAAILAVNNNGTAAPEGTSGWFLPSIGQWNLIVQGLATVKAGEPVTTNLVKTAAGNDNESYKPANLNSVIVAAGGTGFVEEGRADYWSSTMYIGVEAWVLRLGRGSAYDWEINKTANVRSVLAF